MAHQSLHGDRHGLLGPVGDDEPDPLLAAATVRVALDLALVLIERGAFSRPRVQADLDRLAAFDEVIYCLLRSLFGSLLPVPLFLCHYPFSCLFWFRTVRSRAMFFRTSESCPVFSN